MTRSDVTLAPVRFLRENAAPSESQPPVPFGPQQERLAEAWRSRLTNNERRILTLLRRHSNAQGDVSLTYDQIASGAAVHKSCVRAALNGLGRLGLVQETGRLRARGAPRNVYRCRAAVVEIGGSRLPV